MSNLTFANQDRLKTIGRYLHYDKTTCDLHNNILEEYLTINGKQYKIKAKLSRVNKR